MSLNSKQEYVFASTKSHCSHERSCINNDDILVLSIAFMPSQRIRRAAASIAGKNSARHPRYVIKDELAPFRCCSRIGKLEKPNRASQKPAFEPTISSRRHKTWNFNFEKELQFSELSFFTARLRSHYSAILAVFSHLKSNFS